MVIEIPIDCLGHNWGKLTHFEPIFSFPAPDRPQARAHGSCGEPLVKAADSSFRNWYLHFTIGTSHPSEVCLWQCVIERGAQLVILLQLQYCFHGLKYWMKTGYFYQTEMKRCTWKHMGEIPCWFPSSANPVIFRISRTEMPWKDCLETGIC